MGSLELVRTGDRLKASLITVLHTDIDVYTIRMARVRIIELRNDMEAIMDDIGKGLQGIYDPSKPSPVIAKTQKNFGGFP